VNSEELKQKYYELFTLVSELIVVIEDLKEFEEIKEFIDRELTGEHRTKG